MVAPMVLRSTSLAPARQAARLHSLEQPPRFPDSKSETKRPRARGYFYSKSGFVLTERWPDQNFLSVRKRAGIEIGRR